MIFFIKINSSEPTSYCTETKEGLLFDLICDGEEYEVRHYEAAKCLSTEAESMFKDVAIAKAFRKLFKYITGENEAGVKIDMTAPVITKVKEKIPWLDTLFSASCCPLPTRHMLPSQMTALRVYFTDMQVYVKSYGGWMVSPLSKMYSDQLKEALDKAQATYNTDYHYDVGYNSPKKVLNRHNEVWYVVKGTPVCPPAE